MHSDTTRSGPRDLAAIWRGVRQRLTTLIELAAGGPLDVPVAAVDGATVGELIVHLTAIHRRFLESGVPGTALRCSPDAVRADADHVADSGDRLLDGWHEIAAAVPSRLDADAAAATELIVDAVLHEHDLRMALDRAGARDDPAVLVALDALSDDLSTRVLQAGLPPLRVTVEQWGTIAGEGAAVDCVVADRYEFVRAMSGRRSASEVARWNWSTTPGSYLTVLSCTGALRDAELQEHDPRVPAHMRDREFIL